MLLKEDLKGKTIKIRSHKEWIAVQLILFSYGIQWEDTGYVLFFDEGPKYYNICVSSRFKMTCYIQNPLLFDYTYEDIKQM